MQDDGVIGRAVHGKETVGEFEPRSRSVSKMFELNYPNYWI